ncbi:MAG: serine/threonine-protein phosphatase [Acidobacteriia bacterium]|nr:serine/threonine-protein phosphatase [Terriglobia bacterium]
MIESFALTDTGCVRQENQDRILTDHSLSLFVVADGMGGHQHGEVAAELAISTMRYYIESSQDRFDVTWPFGYNFELSVDANRLATAIQLANRQVWNYALQSPECSGMGTTVAAILLSEGASAVIGNVGDSRVYLWRGEQLKQISFDDTFVNTVALQDGADPDTMTHHPMHNVLTQAAGTQDHLDVHIIEQVLESGDLYLICCDGVYGVIGNAAVRSILSTGATLEEIAVRLRNAALAEGGPDNISAVLISFSH